MKRRTPARGTPVEAELESDAALWAPTPRPGRTRRNLPSDEGRRRIIHAARLLFAEQGYDNTTMEQVGRRAGLSRARLYRLFPGRRELFEAIIAQDARALAGELLLALGKATELEAKIEAIVSVFFRFVEEQRERNRVLYSDQGATDPAFAELMGAVRQALADVLSQQLAASSSLGQRSPAELRLMAHAVISMAEGTATAWLNGPHLDLEPTVKIVTQVAVRALGIERTQRGEAAAP
jgi:AcrR family transcriptional regulator